MPKPLFTQPDETACIRSAMSILSDTFITLAELAQHTPLGPQSADPPGWYFSTAWDPVMAIVEHQTPALFRMQYFCTLYQKTSAGVSRRFALHIALFLPENTMDTSWQALPSPTTPERSAVSWDHVWQTLLFSSTP